MGSFMEHDKPKRMIGRTLDSMIDILEKQIVFYDTDRDMEFYNEKDRVFTNDEQLKTKSKNTKLLDVYKVRHAKAVADRNALQKHYDDIFNRNTSIQKWRYSYKKAQLCYNSADSPVYLQI
jgi:hypothetical protein